MGPATRKSQSIIKGKEGLVEVGLGGGVAAEGGEGLGAPPARPVLLHPAAQLPDVAAAAGAANGVDYTRALVQAQLVLVPGPKIFAPLIQTR